MIIVPKADGMTPAEWRGLWMTVPFDLAFKALVPGPYRVVAAETHVAGAVEGQGDG